VTRIEWVADRARLAELSDPWERLAGPAATPFDLPAWFGAWWDAFAAGRRLHVAALWDGDELAGVLPLCARGRKLEALANDHTPLFRPLARDPAALAALARVAADDDTAETTIPVVPTEDAAVEALEAAGRAGGWVDVTPAHTSPIVDVDGDFPRYRDLVKPRWGAPLERFRRKMSRDHDARFELVTVPEDLDGALRQGFEVEGSGWKGRAGTAILSAPETTAFYGAIAMAFAARGELALSWISLDGRMVAFDLCLLRAGRLYLLKTGFDESARRLAPGLVLRLAVVERCFERGLEAHELLGDVAEWKSKFATSERRHVDVRRFRRSPAGAARRTYSAHLRPALGRAYRRLRPGGD
jgi:CelD/BcsL family acetyltransferase involved in cellulose biosynthesis